MIRKLGRKIEPPTHALIQTLPMMSSRLPCPQFLRRPRPCPLTVGFPVANTVVFCRRKAVLPDIDVILIVQPRLPVALPHRCSLRIRRLPEIEITYPLGALSGVSPFTDCAASPEFSRDRSDFAEGVALARLLGVRIVGPMLIGA